VFITVLKFLASGKLRGPALRCILTIWRDFFFFQYQAAWKPGRVPVVRVDHPLDETIPFTPKKVAVYLDFVAFWIRAAGFIYKRYKKTDWGIEATKDFIEKIEGLYKAAREVYGQSLSTTNRPRYLKSPRFIVIHLTDPHLMCVPSLHVMIVVRTYTAFRAILQKAGEAALYKDEIEAMRCGAIAIAEAVLLVKHHSVNCIPAALYAMSRFDPPLFPREEAEDFAAELFSGGEFAGIADAAVLVRDHIVNLYRNFMAEGESAEDWTAPLVAFLRKCPEFVR
jgi:hypothetical protein